MWGARRGARGGKGGGGGQGVCERGPCKREGNQQLLHTLSHEVSFPGSVSRHQHVNARLFQLHLFPPSTGIASCLGSCCFQLLLCCKTLLLLPVCQMWTLNFLYLYTKQLHVAATMNA